ncbi:hypothetical protein MMPV_005574 [Pyropia vietnamensis]
MTFVAGLPARTVVFLVASGASTHYLYEHCPSVVWTALAHLLPVGGTGLFAGGNDSGGGRGGSDGARGAGGGGFGSGDGRGGGGGGGGLGAVIDEDARSRAAWEALSAQVVALTREVQAVTAAPPAVTVIGAPGGSNGDSASRAAWGLLRPSLVAVVGVGLGAAYLRSRGLKAADLTWVSRASFEATVEALRGSLSRLTGVIGSTKRELSDRLGRVEGAVDAAAVDLRALVEANVGGRVAEVGHALEGMRADMDELRSEMHCLGGDVASMTRGLGLLCTVVGGGGADPAARAALEQFGAAYGGGPGGKGIAVKSAPPPAGLLDSPAAAVSAAAAAVAAAASAAAAGGFRSILPPIGAATASASSPPSVVVEEADAYSGGGGNGSGGGGGGGSTGPAVSAPALGGATLLARRASLPGIGDLAATSGVHVRDGQPPRPGRGGGGWSDATATPNWRSPPSPASPGGVPLPIGR